MFMKLRKYFMTLAMALAALMFAPAYAQDELLDEAATEEAAAEEAAVEEAAVEEAAADEADEDEGKSKKKKKKKNKKKSKAKDSKKSRKKDKSAETEADEERTETAAATGEAAVPAALGKFKQLTGKPNLKAEYFIYLYSASWCGYCKQSMPVAVDAYKKIKPSRKVEMIVICGDKSEKECKDYMKSMKAKMPCIWFEQLKATKFQGLPGCGMPGFPAVAIADKNGKHVASGVGAAQVQEIIKNWKAHTIDRK